MKKFTFILVTFIALNVYSQTPTTAPILQQPGKKITPAIVKGNAQQPRTAKKPGIVTNSKTPATLPVTKAPLRNIVYQYVDTAYPSSENHFPINGNAGIGTNTPQAALEIKRNAGDTRKKNVLLQLSNI